MLGVIGSIENWAGNQVLRNYYYADGSILPISQSEALFSIISKIYGGDGVMTFALPNYGGVPPVGFSNHRFFYDPTNQHAFGHRSTETKLKYDQSGDNDYNSQKNHSHQLSTPFSTEKGDLKSPLPGCTLAASADSGPQAALMYTTLDDEKIDSQTMVRGLGMIDVGQVNESDLIGWEMDCPPPAYVAMNVYICNMGSYPEWAWYSN